MSGHEIQSLKRALSEAGIEIYRTDPHSVHVAERIRLHIMDSGIRVRPEGNLNVVAFAIRSQRSDFPNDDAAGLFARVRSFASDAVVARGYEETRTETVEVKDPIDDAKVLDVWHEITFEKRVTDPSTLVDEVRWALGLEKYVSR